MYLLKSNFPRMFPQIQRLRDELKRMQCFLKDADAKHEDDLQVHNWVSDIRNAAYDAEDLIDTYILKIEAYKRWEFVKRYVFTLEALTLKVCSLIGKGLAAIRTRISDISISRKVYGIKTIGEGAN
ncbi:hypothetical protein FF1_041701 [Malus domestica]